MPRTFTRRRLLARSLLALITLPILRYVVSLLANIDDPWNIGDFLINYSAGFVRRGALGSIIDFLDLRSPQAAVFIVALQLSCLVVIWVCLGKMLEAWSYSWTAIAMVAGPLGALFPLNNWPGAFRKENLLLAAFAIVVMPSKSPLQDKLRALLCVILYILTVFSWEPAVLFLPGLLMIFSRRLRQGVLWSLGRAALVTSSVVCLVLPVKFNGNQEQAERICLSTRQMGFGPDVCSGGIAALSRSASDESSRVIANYPQYLSYLVPFGVMLLILARFPLKNRLCAGACTAGVVALLVLCTTSLDYGRWLHLAMVITLMALFGLGYAPTTRRYDRTSAVVLLLCLAVPYTGGNILSGSLISSAVHAIQRLF